MKIKLIVMSSLVLVCLFSGSCGSSRDFDKHLRTIVNPYHFGTVAWEFKAILEEVEQLVCSQPEKVEDEPSLVTEYFVTVEQIRALNSEIEVISGGNGEGDLDSLKVDINKLEQRKMALVDTAEQLLKRQIKETLAQQGIFNPVDKYIGLKVSFPPLNFKLEKPPCLLVVSPRDRIESMRQITLQQSISLEEIEAIEAKVDQLGVSSLVVKLGGIATYPSFVIDDASLRFTVDTITEEWLHQYLVFTPLGFLYLLNSTGVSRNYEIATINETIASMVSKEIGSIVCQSYYPECENDDTQNQAVESEFDFNREMREIRRTVDKYLDQGEIEQAEEFMEQKRQYLASMGYYIRKLNQAYFAFHGTYADSPTSISPIGVELKKLRSQSDSLKDFLNTIAGMTSRQNLKDSIRE